MLTVSQLYIYPVKSLGGVSVSAVELTDRGFKYDRRWMLIDNDNRFLSQRELPAMALLQAVITNKGIAINDKNDPNDEVLIPFLSEGKQISVKVWDDICEAKMINDELDKWFTKKLKINCKLVYMPENSMRKVDERYAKENELTSFSDGYPILIIGQSSLDDLNERLDEPILIDRFRPNIVFEGGQPYEEDEIEMFEINSIKLTGVKLCSRCVITTIDQSNPTKTKEPLQTLATYRLYNKKIYFGQNLLYKGTGTIRKGDVLTILKNKKSVFNK